MPQAQGPISFFTLATETTRAISAYTVYNNSILFPGKIVSGTSTTKTKVLRLRLKDKHAEVLNSLARDVNFVWNYCNELQTTMYHRERRLLSGYDFSKFTSGATKEGLHLHSQTVQAIAEEYATRRRQCRKLRLSWRKSTGSRRSLGWIHLRGPQFGPFMARSSSQANGCLYGTVTDSTRIRFVRVTSAKTPGVAGT